MSSLGSHVVQNKYSSLQILFFGKPSSACFRFWQSPERHSTLYKVTAKSVSEMVKVSSATGEFLAHHVQF